MPFSDCNFYNYSLQYSAVEHCMQWVTVTKTRLQSFDCTSTAKSLQRFAVWTFEFGSFLHPRFVVKSAPEEVATQIQFGRKKNQLNLVCDIMLFHNHWFTTSYLHLQVNKVIFMFELNC